MPWPVFGWMYASKALDAGKAFATAPGIELAPATPGPDFGPEQSPPQKMKS